MFEPFASKEHYDKSFGQSVKARVLKVARNMVRDSVAEIMNKTQII